MRYEEFIRRWHSFPLRPGCVRYRPASRSANCRIVTGAYTFPGKEILRYDSGSFRPKKEANGPHRSSRKPRPGSCWRVTRISLPSRQLEDAAPLLSRTSLRTAGTASNYVTCFPLSLSVTKDHIIRGGIHKGTARSNRRKIKLNAKQYEELSICIDVRRCIAGRIGCHIGSGCR